MPEQGLRDIPAGAAGLLKAEKRLQAFCSKYLKEERESTSTSKKHGDVERQKEDEHFIGPRTRLETLFLGSATAADIAQAMDDFTASSRKTSCPIDAAESYLVNREKASVLSAVDIQECCAVLLDKKRNITESSSIWPGTSCSSSSSSAVKVDEFSLQQVPCPLSWCSDLASEGSSKSKMLCHFINKILAREDVSLYAKSAFAFATTVKLFGLDHAHMEQQGQLSSFSISTKNDCTVTRPTAIASSTSSSSSCNAGRSHFMFMDTSEKTSAGTRTRTRSPRRTNQESFASSLGPLLSPGREATECPPLEGPRMFVDERPRRGRASKKSKESHTHHIQQDTFASAQHPQDQKKDSFGMILGRVVASWILRSSGPLPFPVHRILASEPGVEDVMDLLVSSHTGTEARPDDQTKKREEGGDGDSCSNDKALLAINGGPGRGGHSGCEGQREKILSSLHERCPPPSTGTAIVLAEGSDIRISTDVVTTALLQEVGQELPESQPRHGETRIVEQSLGDWELLAAGEPPAKRAKTDRRPGAASSSSSASAPTSVSTVRRRYYNPQVVQQGTGSIVLTTGPTPALVPFVPQQFLVRANTSTSTTSSASEPQLEGNQRNTRTLASVDDDAHLGQELEGHNRAASVPALGQVIASSSSTTTPDKAERTATSPETTAAPSSGSSTPSENQQPSSSSSSTMKMEGEEDQGVLMTCMEDGAEAARSIPPAPIQEVSRPTAETTITTSKQNFSTSSTSAFTGAPQERIESPPCENTPTSSNLVDEKGLKEHQRPDGNGGGKSISPPSPSRPYGTTDESAGALVSTTDSSFGTDFVNRMPATELALVVDEDVHMQCSCSSPKKQPHKKKMNAPQAPAQGFSGQEMEDNADLSAPEIGLLAAYILAAVNRGWETFETLLEERVLTRERQERDKRRDAARREFLHRARTEETCAICFEPHPNVSALCCGSVFHMDCLWRWLAQGSQDCKTCVCCREVIPNSISRNLTAAARGGESAVVRGSFWTSNSTNSSQDANASPTSMFMNRTGNPHEAAPGLVSFSDIRRPISAVSGSTSVISRPGLAAVGGRDPRGLPRGASSSAVNFSGGALHASSASSTRHELQLLQASGIRNRHHQQAIDAIAGVAQPGSELNFLGWPPLDPRPYLDVPPPGGSSSSRGGRLRLRRGRTNATSTVPAMTTRASRGISRSRSRRIVQGQGEQQEQQDAGDSAGGPLPRGVSDGAQVGESRFESRANVSGVTSVSDTSSNLVNEIENQDRQESVFVSVDPVPPAAQRQRQRGRDEDEQGHGAQDLETRQQQGRRHEETLQNEQQVEDERIVARLQSFDFRGAGLDAALSSSATAPSLFGPPSVIARGFRAAQRLQRRHGFFDDPVDDTEEDDEVDGSIDIRVVRSGGQLNTSTRQYTTTSNNNSSILHQRTRQGDEDDTNLMMSLSAMSQSMSSMSTSSSSASGGQQNDNDRRQIMLDVDGNGIRAPHQRDREQDLICPPLPEGDEEINLLDYLDDDFNTGRGRDADSFDFGFGSRATAYDIGGLPCTHCGGERQRARLCPLDACRPCCRRIRDQALSHERCTRHDDSNRL